MRCAKAGFVYATSPLLLARVKRQLTLTGIDVDWNITHPESGECLVSNTKLLKDNNLALEAYELTAKEDSNLQVIAQWLAKNALPQTDAFKYFHDKLISDLVLLSDDELHYFVLNSTIVEPHVRIDDISGTADGGALFYTENLPSETLLFSLIMASQERYKRGEKPDSTLTAVEVMDALVKGKDQWQALHGRMVQFGGDATTGRGQIICSIAGAAND